MPSKNKTYLSVDLELDSIESHSGKLIKIYNIGDTSSSKLTFSKGNILYSKLRPYLKKYYFTNFDGICSSEFWVFQPSNKIYDKFFFYYVQTDKFNYLANKTCGTKMPRAEWSLLQSKSIFFPSIYEQKKISKTLDYITSIITALETKLMVLKKYKEGLAKKFLRETIDNWKGKENRGIKLKEFLIETKEYSEKDGTLPHLTLSKDGVEPKTDRYDRDFLVNDKKKKYKMTKINQLCYNPANLKFGVICINHFGSGIFSPIYVTFQIQKIYINYLEMILTSKDFVNYSLRYQEGTVYERMAVSVDDFVNIQIVPCSEDDQKLISNVLKSLQKIIKIENQKLNILDSIKNYFLNNMFI